MGTAGHITLEQLFSIVAGRGSVGMKGSRRHEGVASAGRALLVARLLCCSVSHFVGRSVALLVAWSVALSLCRKAYRNCLPGRGHEIGTKLAKIGQIRDRSDIH